MARGQKGQSEDIAARMPGPELRGRKCNYFTLAGKPKERGSMSRGLQKEKQKINHGGVGKTLLKLGNKNLLKLGRQLLLH